MACVPSAMTALSLLVGMYSVHDLLVMMESIAEGLVEGSVDEDRKQSWRLCVEDVRAALQAILDLQAVRYLDITDK